MTNFNVVYFLRHTYMNPVYTYFHSLYEPYNSLPSYGLIQIWTKNKNEISTFNIRTRVKTNITYLGNETYLSDT